MIWILLIMVVAENRELERRRSRLCYYDQRQRDLLLSKVNLTTVSVQTIKWILYAQKPCCTSLKINLNMQKNVWIGLLNSVSLFYVLIRIAGTVWTCGSVVCQEEQGLWQVEHRFNCVAWRWIHPVVGEFCCCRKQ